MHTHNITIDSPFVLEGTLTSVGEDGVVYLALRNQTSKERVRVKVQRAAGKAVLASFVLNSVYVEDNIEATKLLIEFVNKAHEELNLDDTSSFARNLVLLSSTEMSEKWEP